MESLQWLSTDDAARYFGVKHRTILLWRRQGKIKGYKLKNTKRPVWRFLRADLDAALLHDRVVISDVSTAVSEEKRV